MSVLIDIVREFVFTSNKYKRKSLWYLIRKGLAYLYYIPVTWYYKRTWKATFRFGGVTHRYFCHLYNATWRNERAVEIPIVLDYITEFKMRRGSKMLEVGNVLGHYATAYHKVLDKYEIGECIINEDIADYQPDKKYQLVVAISTLEHVGWDEGSDRPHKLLDAIDNLKRNVLTSDGKLLATMPVGYNPCLDDLLLNGKLPFESIRCMRRPSHKSRKWREVVWNPQMVHEAEQREGYGSTILVICETSGTPIARPPAH